MKLARPEVAVCAGVLALALGQAGCGGDDERRTTTEPASPPDAAPEATGPATTPKPGRREGEAPGGERSVRVPATFTLREGRLVPAEVRVAPFLAVRISVAATDGRAHTVTISADRLYRLRVPPGGRGSVLLPGQRPGRYEVRADGAVAALEVGGG